MSFEVTISERAEKNLDKVFEYLADNWPPKVSSDFKDKLSRVVEHLRENPYMFEPSTSKKGVRRCFITSHNAMYYRVVGKEVEIITIHDTRSDPKSLKL
jgi:plasmid stabilization system protein ParE